MNKNFTFSNQTSFLNPGRWFALLATVLFSGLGAFAQYCAVDHYYGCGYNNNKLYAAIEEVGFEVNGNSIYSKAADGCVDIANNRNSGSHGHTVEATPAFTLSYGADFTLLINGSDRYYTNMSLGIWIDLNRDGDFADKGEFFGNKSVTTCQGNTGCSLPALTKINLSLPCGASGSGSSMIRLRSTYRGYTWTSGNSCAKGAGAPQYYGETEDYAINLAVPSTLAAGFFVSDTSFVKTPVSLVNNNQEGYFYHGWDILDDGSIEYTTTNASHKFSTPGNYCVKLLSENCLGRDSVVKCLTIVKPTQPPVADFVSDRNKVELYNTFQLTDLSTNGAIYWDWFMYQDIDSTGTRIDGDDYYEMRGGDETINQNPEIFTAKGIPGFPDVGLWNVGLTSSNDVGASVTIIKKDYIEVIKGCDVEMGPGTVTGIPGNVITCETGTIKNKDNGSGNYATPEANLDALVAPCGATSITFIMDTWQVKANVNLKIYDGQNANGTPLHTGSGFTSANPPTAALVAKSGALYFLWNASGTATDKGFTGHWTSTIGTQAKPVASFDVNDTLYNAVVSTFTNTSKNAKGEVFYSWTIDGSPVANSTNLDQLFLSNATYNVCLTVETCSGKNTWCRNVVVAPITSQAELDFTADERRPRAGDEVNFEVTTDKANTYLWTFFPGSTVQYGNGTSNRSKNPSVTFSKSGKYTVSLKGWNNLSPSDSAISLTQVIKDQYIIVIDYCKPLISVTSSADVAINRVILEDNASPRALLLDNESDESTYSDYTDDDEVVAPTLTFGGTYNLAVSRKTTVNKMSRMVWIDWNIDGDFDDNGELVASEGPANTATLNASFTVPDLKNSFEGRTRLRIGTSYNNDPNMPCGASSGVKNANRIGEFEDYTLVLSNDNTMPIITLNGDDTVYVELNKTYGDAGAIAMDPTEGNITSRMITVSDVDESAAGIYYVTYNASDASGNMAQEVIRVVYVVVDQSAPELTLKGNNPEYIEVITGSYTEAGWTATDLTDGNLETAVQVAGTVNTFKIGTYVLTYSVQDAQGNVATATREVIVRDQVFPTITNDEINMDNGRNVVAVQLQSVFVDRTVPNDNYNNGTFGPLFSYTITPSNAQGEADVDTRLKSTTIVTYVATDETGNATTLVIDYVVEDYVAPVISLNTLDTVYHSVNGKYTPVEPSVTDNLYDQTQVSLTRTTNVNPYVLGLYTDTYTATDASGNVSVQERWVRVFDGEAPVISGKFGPIVRLGLFSRVALVDYLKMSDNYDAPSDLFNNVMVTYNDVNVYEEGIYAAVFETSDNSGNTSAPFTLIVEIDRDYPQVSGINDVNSDNLMTVYPNPSNGLFNVKIDLPSNELVNLSVYDLLGNKVEDVVNGDLQKGNYTIDMSQAASGVYFVRMIVHGKVFNQKVVID
jgi:PKD repeat protein